MPPEYLHMIEGAAAVVALSTAIWRVGRRLTKAITSRIDKITEFAETTSAQLTQIATLAETLSHYLPALESTQSRLDRLEALIPDTTRTH